MSQGGTALTLRSSPESVSALAEANGLTVSIENPVNYQDDLRDPRPNTLVYTRALSRADGTHAASVVRDGDPLIPHIGFKEREPFSCSDALTYQGLIAEIREGK